MYGKPQKINSASRSLTMLRNGSYLLRRSSTSSGFEGISAPKSIKLGKNRKSRSDQGVAPGLFPNPEFLLLINQSRIRLVC
ncbi:hypothetical protein HI914_00094 [Erysiphe necator]|nr:hypothetical protein HI914_00094 [Erysiphe necator]